MHPYLLDQMAEDRWRQLSALGTRRQLRGRARPAHAARLRIARLLIDAGSALAPAQQEICTG